MSIGSWSTLLIKSSAIQIKSNQGNHEKVMESLFQNHGRATLRILQKAFQQMYFNSFQKTKTNFQKIEMIQS